MRAPTDKQGPPKVGDLFLSNWVIERVVGRAGTPGYTTRAIASSDATSH